MTLDNVFVTLADFIIQDLLGGSVIGYTLFALFITAVLFVILMTLRVPPKMGLLIISPAIIGVFSGLVNITWIIVVLLIIIAIILAIMALRWYGGER